MTPELLRARIKERLFVTGTKPVPLAVALGKSKDFISSFLLGKKNSINHQTLVAMAEALGCSPDYFLKANATATEQPINPPKGDGHDADSSSAKVAHLRLSSISPPSVPAHNSLARLEIQRRIPVLGEVGAGVWREALVREQYQVEEHIAIDVPGFESSKLFALRVEGPSMNVYYPHGRYVVVSPVITSGVEPGDHVVVERSNGALTETTLKEYAVEEDGRVALYPRSFDPAYQEPVYISGDPDDQTAPRIIGIVVADYGLKVRRPAAPLPFPGRRPTE